MTLPFLASVEYRGLLDYINLRGGIPAIAECGRILINGCSRSPECAAVGRERGTDFMDKYICNDCNRELEIDEIECLSITCTGLMVNETIEVEEVCVMACRCRKCGLVVDYPICCGGYYRKL